MPETCAEYWCIDCPDGWEVERSNGTVTCYDPNGPGALQLSALRNERPIDDEFLRHLAADHLQAGAPTGPAECGAFSGFELSYDDDDLFWREWYLRAGHIVVFATYNCPLADEGAEEAAVDAILETLREPRG